MKVIGPRRCLLASTLSPAIAGLILIVGCSRHTPAQVQVEMTTEAFALVVCPIRLY